MKIERKGSFRPIVITLETKDDVKQLLSDINMAESYMVNEYVPPLRKRLNDVTLVISNELGDMIQ